jgi:transposase-like protein
MAAPESPYRQKLTEAQRAQVVDDVRGGQQIERVAEKYGISSASVWHLVDKAAFRELAREAGLPPMRPHEYLRHRAKSAANGTPGTGGAPNTPGQVSVAEAARAAARALQRLADAAAPGSATPSSSDPHADP